MPARAAKRALLLGLVILTSCSQAPASTAGKPVRALYLVNGQGQLDHSDLAAHPEVVLTSSFDKLKAAARSKIAIWIDDNAVGLVDTDWLARKPQSFYPVVLVGDGSWLCAFRMKLVYFMLVEPPFECAPPTVGFSVNLHTSDTGGWGHGYAEKPTVERILGITDGLLQGRLPNGSPVP
ncbi:MAG TPA: hypothetical protein VF784_13035 [Anaerolineales bacterium]